jgi:hypothetical protein
MLFLAEINCSENVMLAIWLSTVLTSAVSQFFNRESQEEKVGS